MERVYLLTGRPGSGKTSLVKQVVARMTGKAGGFYTEEIRSSGVREGFRLLTLNGAQAILAHINIKSQYRVSKYGIDVDALELVGVPAIYQAIEHRDLVVIDEIGKMELFSVQFREAVLQIIDSGKPVLGTIMLKPHPWADAIKRHPRVKLVTVTRDNHPRVLEELRQWLSEQ